MKEHNYMRAILSMIARGELSDTDVEHIWVEHDDDCAMLTKRDLWCDCKPTIRRIDAATLN